MNFQIKQGDALDILRKMDSESVQCVVTSPPYWGLRDYQVSGQIGLEETPEEYVSKLVEIFREARRVLKSDGVVWLNLGDAYNGGGRGGPKSDKSKKQKTNIGSLTSVQNIKVNNLKPKDLIGLPWRVAFALQAGGWWLRQDIIWAKPNPMPESVTDRCTKSHEYIFMLSKSAKYYYDNEAIQLPMKECSKKRIFDCVKNNEKYDINRHKTDKTKMAQSPYEILTRASHNLIGKEYCNRRSVWKIPTQPYAGAHFATFPLEIPLTCIKAGSKKDDMVLDPFAGSGTTGIAALQLDRDFIGIELNPEYCKMAESRLNATLNNCSPTEYEAGVRGMFPVEKGKGKE